MDADRLGKLLRLLSTDKDAEALVALSALKRTLESERMASTTSPTLSRRR
jgi:hypothetical protein